MEFYCMAQVEPDPDGGFLVTFADVPEAITHGDTRQAALANATEALGLALRGYCAEGRELPKPIAKTGARVDIDALDAIKLAVIMTFRQAGISKSELARRLGKAESEARRILDPDHPTKLGAMQDALRAMGRTIVISVKEAA